MIRVTRITSGATDGGRRVVTVWRTVREQPGWITRLALTAFLLVLAVPIALLLLAALAAAAVVFAVLVIGHRMYAAVARLRPRPDGRENVVVRRGGDERV